MRASSPLFTALLTAITVLPTASAAAQRRPSDRTWRERDYDQWVDDCRRRDGGDRARFCEVRRLNLPARGRLAVDGRENGGVTVQAWDRDEIQVVAMVQAYGDDAREARDVASDIRIETDGRIRATGPSRWRDRGWSVSYDVYVPRRTDLDLQAMNGGIRVRDVEGRMDLATVNGGLSLTDVAGDVRGETSNGGVDVELDGDRWRGAGLDVRTQNGGVRLYVPDRYSAHLETGTVNGGIHLDFPITVRGSFGRRISTDLGSGGATIRVTTSNGGVSVLRR